MPGPFAREKTAFERHVDNLQVVIDDLERGDLEAAKTDLRNAKGGLLMAQADMQMDESRNAWYAAKNNQRSAELEAAEAQSPPRLKLQA